MEGANLLPTSQGEKLQITPAEMAAGGGGGGDRHASPAASLHSVRKPPATKPWRKPTPLPIPPKVYRVHPRGFRELVQRLTGATDLAPRGLEQQEAVPAPPPAPVQQARDHLQGGGAPLWSSSTPAPTWDLPPGLSAAAEPAPQSTSSNAGYADQYSQIYPAADFPSPSLYSACLTWFNSPLLSPGSMACLEQSTVL